MECEGMCRGVTVGKRDVGVSQWATRGLSMNATAAIIQQSEILWLTRDTHDCLVRLLILFGIHLEHRESHMAYGTGTTDRQY